MKRLRGFLGEGVTPGERRREGVGAVPHLLGWVQDVTHRPAGAELCQGSAPWGHAGLGQVGASPGLAGRARRWQPGLKGQETARNGGYKQHRKYEVPPRSASEMSPGDVLGRSPAHTQSCPPRGASAPALSPGGICRRRRGSDTEPPPCLFGRRQARAALFPTCCNLQGSGSHRRGWGERLRPQSPHLGLWSPAGQPGTGWPELGVPA